MLVRLPSAQENAAASVSSRPARDRAAARLMQAGLHKHQHTAAGDSDADKMVDAQLFAHQHDTTAG